MSAFGNYEKDDIVSAIKALAAKEHEDGKSDREIIESIMEAVSYGLDKALYALWDEKADK